MKIHHAFLAAVAIIGWSGPAASASPALPNQSHQLVGEADIPFDPPLDAKVRYRWEKTVQRDGKTDRSWSVDDFQFEATDSGYRLTITPVSSGSNETDPRMLAMMKRLDELTRRPFVLRLNEDGEIKSLEDADFYWTSIFDVLKEEMAKDAAKDPARREIIANVLGMFQRMPAETRQAYLTESIQAAIEFANTHLEVAKPIRSSVPTPSLYGETINREVTISLRKVADGTAFLSITSTIPRGELDKLTQAFLKQMTAIPAGKREEAGKAMASLEGFNHDTRSDYEVSVEDGLVERFQSTETIEASAKGKQSRKVTTRSLTRID